MFLLLPLPPSPQVGPRPEPAAAEARIPGGHETAGPGTAVTDVIVVTDVPVVTVVTVVTLTLMAMKSLVQDETLWRSHLRDVVDDLWGDFNRTPDGEV